MAARLLREKGPTWAEAANRMIYAAPLDLEAARVGVETMRHNMRRMGHPAQTPYYGDFTVVFNSALAVQPAGCLHVGAAGSPIVVCLVVRQCARQPGEGFRAHRTLSTAGEYTMC